MLDLTTTRGTGALVCVHWVGLVGWNYTVSKDTGRAEAVAARVQCAQRAAGDGLETHTADVLALAQQLFRMIQQLFLLIKCLFLIIKNPFFRL